VAAKLAHTGGTRDKLSVLPGFRLAHVNEMANWNKRKAFRYFAVGTDLCPRDTAMYRIRSETGTVADLGLMASSIMSKQIALPADVIVLDVLYGPTAFIKCESKAEEFGQLCASIGSNNKINVIPKLREAPELLGRSVGASTELLEAAEILSGKELHDSARAELSTAISFLRLFARNLGLNSETVAIQVERAITSGDAFSSMLTIWQEHGVESSFLSSFARNPRAALLGKLPSMNLLAPVSGRLQWDAVAVADIANHVINQNYRVDEQHNGVIAGGLELSAMSGAWVSQGDVLAKIYASNAEEAESRLRKTVSIGDTL
tara:strand:- start:375 stop:1328 length:954 start_codon:yes stop_codon:yes gene_type:complete